MAGAETRTAPVSGFAAGVSSRTGVIALRLPLVVFFLALMPRLFNLGARPFWSDELLTAGRAALPVPALIHSSLLAHHTPVYFLLVAPFAHLPDPQFWLRVPSALLGALNVVLVYSIAAQAGGRTAGIAAALIMGLAPIEIAYAQDARSYMLMIFFLLIALQALTTLALSGERAALPLRSGGQARVWLQFIAGSAAAVCTLGDALPWLLATLITALLMLRRVPNRAGLLRNFLTADAICLAACLPLYLMMAIETGKLHNSLKFVPATTPSLIGFDIGSVYLLRIGDFISPHFLAVPTPQALTAAVGGGIGLAFFRGLWRLRQNPMLAACLLPAVFTLPVLFGLFSLIKPVLLVRYLLWSGPPFAMLAGLGVAAALENCRPRLRYCALAGIALLLLFNLMPFYHAETKPRWDIAAKIFASQAGPQDVVYYFNPGDAWTMRYYLPAPFRQALLVDVNEDLQHAMRARARGQRVWAIYGDTCNNTDLQSRAEFQASLAVLGAPSAELHAGERIILWRYDPATE
jgi:4-amino-4-deoxy-L-arabinose transferase-like glycosyltransferase